MPRRMVGTRPSATTHAASRRRRCGPPSRGLPGLVASYGPALIDKAVADGVLKALKLSFPKDCGAMSSASMRGRRRISTRSASEPSWRISVRSAKVRLRHTIGMLDALQGEGSLAEEIAHARLLLFKIKIGGDVDADIARLQAIHALLSLAGAGLPRDAGRQRAIRP